ncbi:MAG: hypothetical protein OXI76_08370 [Gemmatimonadota bacterium]|nr:hypothetical protein [Gemmatimonadota bacterium]MYE68471.1 hypothetical protein [Gemmatimonadota bacterium]
MFIRRSDTRNLRRVGAACICLLHIGVAAVLGPADAVLDAERALAPIHIESPGYEDCASHHGHLFCQLVRALSLADISQSISVANPHAPPVRHPDRSREANHSWSTPIMSGSVIPRGPPVLF